MTTRFFIFSAVVALSSPAFAQNAENEEAVPQLGMEREKISFDNIEPLLTVETIGHAGIKFSDNIYRSAEQEKSDFIGIVAPGLEFKSRTDKHNFRVVGQVEAGKYADESRNDYIDAGAKLNYSRKIIEGWSAIFNGRLRSDHVAIGSFLDEPQRQASEPAIYRQAEAEAGIDAQEGRFKLEARTGLDYINYDNTSDVQGNEIINDDRDFMTYNLGGRFGYMVDEKTFAYLLNHTNLRRYDNRIDSTAADERDSRGYTFGVGAEYGDKKEDTLWGDGYVGYLTQQYNSDNRADIDGVAVGLDSKWEIRPNLRLIGQVVRDTNDNTLLNSSGFIRTQYGVGAEMDVAPQWTAGVLTRYTKYAFEPQSNTPDRSDSVLDVTPQISYAIDNTYRVGMEYQYVNRSSTNSLVEYTSNGAMLRLSAGY